MWSNALADLADGCLQRARGSTIEALTSTARAGSVFSSVAMHLHAAVARRRKGEWIGGDAGQTMVAEADQWLQDHGIVNPSKMAWMMAPARQR